MISSTVYGFDKTFLFWNLCFSGFLNHEVDLKALGNCDNLFVIILTMTLYMMPYLML